MLELDNIHYSFRRINGANKAFNLILSARDDGKTTSVTMQLYKPCYLKGIKIILLVRNIVDISEGYFNQIEYILNKFASDGETFKVTFSRTDARKGVCPWFINGKKMGLIAAVSIPVTRIKRLIDADVKYIVFDEYIVNVLTGEKYLKNEFFWIYELYKTFKRETDFVKFYFIGNPYTAYSPFTSHFNINTNDIIKHKNKIFTGKLWAVDYHDLNPILLEKLKKDPLFNEHEDDAYTKYALMGETIADYRFRLQTEPILNKKLDSVFRYNGKYIAVFTTSIVDIWFTCEFIDKDNISKRRVSYVFDFNELVEGTNFLLKDDKKYLRILKEAIAQRRITYENAEIAYSMEEIFELL